jgi:hypothetical protein
MKTRRARGRVAIAVSLWLLLAIIVDACGGRTGLLVPEEPGDASVDSTADVLEDVRPDHDARVLPTCTPRTCAQLGYKCGANGDGCGNRIDCGTCPVPETCGVAGYSQCGGGFGLGPDGGPLCTPTTCLKLGFTCGFAGDGCGGVLQCGICQYPDVCGGKGVPGHCGNSLPCTNLCQQQVQCDAGTTSIRGTVVTGMLPKFGAPDPIYSALVYVPNSAVLPFQPGVQCSQCGADVTGEPLVATQTGPDGTFTLDNMPVGTNIPLVIQLGRWRRQVTIPVVAPCTTTTLPRNLTRMPRNSGEGDIPLTAIATGEADQTECLLMKMGVDQAEFTTPAGGGRMQVYVSNGSDVGPTTPLASALTSSLPALETYDIVLLPCEGMELIKPTPDLQNLVSYASAGGRVFATHYSYAWFFQNPPFSTTANWVPTQNGTGTATGTIDTSFQKGQDFATWLNGVGALSGPNQIQIQNSRQDVTGVVAPTQQFITMPGEVFQLGFYTPVGQPASQQCGRVVFSDFHVSGSGGLSNGTTFPAECTLGPLTGQEKALEFMLFDLASCIPAAPQNCTPRSCAQQNIGCGPAGDGCGGELDCGRCPTPQTCGGGGTYGQCGYPDAGTCFPESCAQKGFNCGVNGDGCGNAINCGSCVSPQICGGGGKPSVCGP